MISADQAMYASKRSGKNRVMGLPIAVGGRETTRCSIEPCRTSRPPGWPPSDEKGGFSTRAIRGPIAFRPSTSARLGPDLPDRHLLER